MTGTCRGIVSAAIVVIAVALPENASARQPQTAAPAFSGNASWRLKLPSDSAVEFHGLVNYDNAGSGQGAMLYPAFDPISFLAAIATHAAVNESVREHQKSQLQAQADKVLDPYRAILEHFTYQELMQRGLTLSTEGAHARPAEVSDPAQNPWLLESTPVFSLTQDQRALVLDNTVVLYAAGGHKPAYANSVRVISAPLAVSENPQVHWQADDGQVLTEESSSMFAKSVDIFLHSVIAVDSAEAPKQKTVRYPKGGEEGVERAFVLDENCSSLTLKTLRGWLMSVPAIQRPDCKAAAPSPPAPNVRGGNAVTNQSDITSAVPTAAN